jgi:hypothetical protein
LTAATKIRHVLRHVADEIRPHCSELCYLSVENPAMLTGII